MDRDQATLLDIEIACRLVLSFVGDMTQDAFLNDAKTQSSVMYQLLVLGEAVKRLSMVFRELNQGIAWSAIAGMRDHLIHAYDTVDWDTVWAAVTVDIPRLLDDVMSLRPEGSDRSSE